MEYIPSNDCQIIEGCLAHSGIRTLLRFDGTVVNIGSSALDFGPPENNDAFEYHSCHDHYHFGNWMEFEVLDTNTMKQVIKGSKIGFCILDFNESSLYTGDKSLVPSAPVHLDCNVNPGLSVGYFDTYVASLPCQFIDVTELEYGNYILQGIVNPVNIFEEENTQNNVIQIPFTYGVNSLTKPISDYVPTRYNFHKWKKALNYIRSDISKTINVIPQICIFFCFTEEETKAFFQLLKSNVKQLRIKTHTKDVIYHNGFFEAKSHWKLRFNNGCVYSDTSNDIVYYNSNGNIRHARHSFDKSQTLSSWFLIGQSIC